MRLWRTSGWVQHRVVGLPRLQLRTLPRVQLSRCCSGLRIVTYCRGITKEEVGRADVVLSTLSALYEDHMIYNGSAIWPCMLRANLDPTDDELRRDVTHNWKELIDTEHPLISQKWDRVIYDEAHNVKSDVTSHALKARAVWALTGTAIRQSYEDDVAQLLDLVYGDRALWMPLWPTWLQSQRSRRGRKAVRQRGHETHVAALLARVAVRHHRKLVYPSGNPVVPVPPVQHETVHVKMDSGERMVYLSLFRAVRQQVVPYASVRLFEW